jgi:hypothetical protein
MQGLFDLLGTGADAGEGRVAARRTNLDDGPAKITMVATQAFALQVQGQRYAAIGAAQDLAAMPALQKIGEAASVEEDQALA